MDSPQSWWSAGSSLVGFVLFLITAGAVGRVTIDLDAGKLFRRKGIGGWFREPSEVALSELRGIALGRRKLSRSSSASWAPLLVWQKQEIHVLDVGDGLDFPNAGREVRRIGEAFDLEVLDSSAEVKWDWQVVPIAMADCDPSMKNLFSSKDRIHSE